jgi:hypothetical protein
MAQRAGSATGGAGKSPFQVPAAQPDHTKLTKLDGTPREQKTFQKQENTLYFLKSSLPLIRYRYNFLQLPAQQPYIIGRPDHTETTKREGYQSIHVSDKPLRMTMTNYQFITLRVVWNKANNIHEENIANS